MEEKQLFEEIKPLMQEYKEYANREMPEAFNWNDLRASSMGKIQEKNYTADREGEILEILREENVVSNRRKLIEELSQIRETKKSEMRSTIFEKVSAFMSDSREKMNQEIESKRKELEAKKEEKRIKLEEKQQELEEKEQIIKDMKENSKAYDDEAMRIKGNKKLEEGYKFFRSKNKEINANIYDLNRDIKPLKRECETLKFDYEDFIIENDEGLKELVARLSEFDEIYGNIDFESEDAINYIETIMENSELTIEEPEETKPEETKPEETKPEETKSEETKPEETKPEETKPEETKPEETKPEETKPEETKSEETKPEETKPEETKSEETKPEGTKPEETKPEETKSEETKPEETKSEETKPKRAKQKATVKDYRVMDSNGREIDDIETIRAIQEKQILEEELEQRLQEIKAGNEDLVNDDYLLVEDDLKKRENIEEVLKSLEGRTMKDIYNGILQKAETPEEKEELEGIISELDSRETQSINQEQEHEEIVHKIEQKFVEYETGNEDLLLSSYYGYRNFYIDRSYDDYEYAKQVLEYCERGNLINFYKDILNDITKEGKSSDKNIADIANIENVIAQIAERDKHRIKHTTIVMEPFKDLIKVNIKGRAEAIELNDLLNLEKKGKELQEEYRQKDIYDYDITDPIILEVLTQIGKEYPANLDLADEYMYSFYTEQYGIDDLKIDDIIYHFNGKIENKANNYIKIVDTCKQYAKDGKRFGMATIEGSYKISLLDRMKETKIGSIVSNLITKQSQKRLEGKIDKEYKLSRDDKAKGKREKKNEKRKNKEDKENQVKKRNPNEFIKKLQEKAKKGKGETLDMSEAIEKLKAINIQTERTNEEEKDEEEVL